MTTERCGITRRALGAGLLGAAIALPVGRWRGAAAQDDIAESLVIDLDGELESIHPSLAYSGRDWSVVHAIYDSIVMIDDEGAVIPLAAEAFETDDAQTFRVRMREGLTFHDGSPVTAETLRGSWEFLMGSGSSAADVFSVITDVTVDGDLEATIVCASPAPWLPAQIATWLVLVPAGYTEEQALSAPIGTGPYRLESWNQGQDVELSRFAEYALADVKGAALAKTVTFRIVPDPATRVADVITGTSNIASAIPQDFRGEVEGQGVTLIDDPLVGSAWIRIAADRAPFDDVRVRQALNHAIDSATIVEALLVPETRQLGSIFPDERAPGYLASVEPYGFDPDRARQLLEDAGVEEGTQLELEITQSARADIAEAIAANLGDVGFDVEVVTSDITSFNAGWADPEQPVLRMATWSPLYEPHTLLSLVFASEGFLSRFASDEIDGLITQAASEADPDTRRALYESLNEAMHEEAPVIFLWNLTATYAVAGPGQAWTPRGNEQILPTGNG